MCKLAGRGTENTRLTCLLDHSRSIELDAVADGKKKVPREWTNERGNMPTQEFLDYVRPLVQGEVPIQIRGGLPLYARLKGILAEKRLPPWKPSGK